MTRPSGMTFVEILAAILLLSMGLLAAIGLIFFGALRAARNQSEMTAMMTVMSVAYDRGLAGIKGDPTTLESGASTPDEWDPDASAIPATGAYTIKDTGYVNGYYVIRTESVAAADVLSSDPVTNERICWRAMVQCEAFDGYGGRSAASFNTSLLRQRGR